MLFPHLDAGGRGEPYFSGRVKTSAERQESGLRSALRQRAGVPLAFSCTDWRTARREAQYVGDAARGTSRLLWEAVVQ